MKVTKNLSAIGERYSGLAESTCCLSCGGAVDLAEPQPGEVCVDLGSGRGQDVLRLAEAAGPAGFAYGIDVSEGMLSRARRTAEKLGVENARFVQSELERIDLPDETADLVISNCTINHAGDKQRVWDELYRITKPGGRFVISDIYSLEPVPERYRDDPKAVAECWAGAVPRNEYLDTVAKAGFSEVSVLEESPAYPKGEIHVASFTISGRKQAKRSCCGCS